MKHVHFITLMFSVLSAWALSSQAQDGPFVPCSDCVSGLDQVFPSSGPWVNTERDGSGFVLHFQNGVMGGFHFGYDAEGNPEWLLISGVLSSGEDVPWVVEADAMRFSGGSCIGCPHAPPMDMSPAVSVRLEFLQRNYGSFQFEGDDQQFMVPLLFGSAGMAHFHETTPYLFPELTRDPDLLDAWAIVFVERVPVIPEFCGASTCAPKNSMVVHFHRGEVVEGNSEMEDKVIYRSLEESLIEGNSDPLLTIECGRFENDDLLCEVTVTDGVHDEIYRMPIANLGSNRFVANGPNGTIEGFRLGYD